MAVYKVIQDIEAEDKIVGFLTLKSFIYAIIAVILGYINLRLAMAGGLGPLRFAFILVFLFPMLLFGILAAPLGRDQPTEVWILSHVRFFLKNRERIWDQSGQQELVTITAPKKTERNFSKGLSQNEVQSRLQALATTLDSRGWAVKNVAINLNANPSYLDVRPEDSDRLISASSLAQGQTAVDVTEKDDILDEQNNPTARNFNNLMQQADAKRKDELRNKVSVAMQEDQEQQNKSRDLFDSTFLDQTAVASDNSGNTSFVGHKIVAPGTSESIVPPAQNLGSAEEDFLNRMHQKAEMVHQRAGNFKPKTEEELSATAPILKTASTRRASTVTEQPQNVKLKELMEVAQDDKISTLSKEAKRQEYRIKEVAPGEVEIDLH